jgi:hypothetical protein
MPRSHEGDEIRMSTKSPITKTEAERPDKAQPRAHASPGLTSSVQRVQPGSPGIAALGTGIFTAESVSYAGADGYPELALYMEQCSEEVIF